MNQLWHQAFNFLRYSFRIFAGQFLSNTSSEISESIKFLCMSMLHDLCQWRTSHSSPHKSTNRRTSTRSLHRTPCHQISALQGCGLLDALSSKPWMDVCLKFWNRKLEWEILSAKPVCWIGFLLSKKAMGCFIWPLSCSMIIRNFPIFWVNAVSSFDCCCWLSSDFFGQIVITAVGEIDELQDGVIWVKSGEKVNSFHCIA